MKALLLGAVTLVFFLAFSRYTEANDAVSIADASKPASADQKRPFTLQDCYRLALMQSELIAVDAERIKEAEARFLQAFGTLLPQVSLSRSETRNNSETSPSYNKRFEQKFVFTQALFSGFKEFAGMAGSRFEKQQREEERRRAQQLLFVDVSDAFYLLLEIREDLNALQVIEKALLDRIDELKARQNIGKSRESEVVSTQTQLYNVQAEIELVKSQELVGRELLEFLIGRAIDTIAEPDNDFNVKSESEYAAKASSRADVQAANLAWRVDQKQVAVAKSGFLPTVSLESDYYTHRNSIPTDSRWDAVLTVDVPIFEGTTTFGKVKEAVSKAKQSELLFRRAARIAVQDIHDMYVNMQAALLRKNALDKALKSAELNYSLQIEDYKLSVVNNLDVLTAIQSLEDARRNFIHVSYESRRFYWQLLAVAGEIEVDK